MTTIMSTTTMQAVRGDGELAALEARSISAWFGERKVFHRASMIHAGGVGDRVDRALGLRRVDPFLDDG